MDDEAGVESNNLVQRLILLLRLLMLMLDTVDPVDTVDPDTVTVMVVL